MTREQDAKFMRIALALSKRGLGQVWPWPSVGCVLVRDDVIVGRGCSDRASMRHAERVALDQAGEAARGATAYVTLEPCCHHGSTPPCVSALIDSQVARVVVATQDPNPLVNGKGIDMLRKAGIAVETGVMEAGATRLNAGFMLAQTENRPFVTLKLASSIDGRIATASGESKWITGPQARRKVHALRASHDAVMVGGGTARIDDPDLRVRNLGVAKQPVRVVVSSKLDVALSSNLAKTAKDAPLWLVHSSGADASLVNAWQGLGAKTLEIAAQRVRHLNPKDVLETLANAGLTRVFCEGGGMWAASLLQAGLVDELIQFGGGVVMGAEGQPMVGALGIDRLTNAPRFELVESAPCGPDTMTRWARS